MKSSVQSMGGKARALIQKEEARKRIDEYNLNPNLCLNCSNPIIAPYDKKLRETKAKKFCSKSCSTQYNNKIRKKPNRTYRKESILGKCSDEAFINAYNNNSSYSDLAMAIGYKSSVNSALRKQLIERINELELDEYTDKTIALLDMTKKELISRCSSWQNWRSSIQKNARETYRESDKPKKCIVCGYDKTYEVAHIKPVSSFDDNSLISEINSIDNLIAMCPNHHWEYDNGQLDLTDYISYTIQ